MNHRQPNDIVRRTTRQPVRPRLSSTPHAFASWSFWRHRPSERHLIHGMADVSEVVSYGFASKDATYKDAPMPPGEEALLWIVAAPGDHLTVAAMVGQSNDQFAAIVPGGLSLFDDDGSLRIGDHSEHLGCSTQELRPTKSSAWGRTRLPVNPHRAWELKKEAWCRPWAPSCQQRTSSCASRSWAPTNKPAPCALAARRPTLWLVPTTEAPEPPCSKHSCLRPLASRYAGREFKPGPLPMTGVMDGANDVAVVTVEVLQEGAIGETVAAGLAAVMLERATDPDVRSEAKHAQRGVALLGMGGIRRRRRGPGGAS